jgi:hypothetical protein
MSGKASNRRHAVAEISNGLLELYERGPTCPLTECRFRNDMQMWRRLVQGMWHINRCRCHLPTYSAVWQSWRKELGCKLNFTDLAAAWRTRPVAQGGVPPFTLLEKNAMVLLRFLTERRRLMRQILTTENTLTSNLPAELVAVIAEYMRPLVRPVYYQTHLAAEILRYVYERSSVPLVGEQAKTYVRDIISRENRSVKRTRGQK